MNDIFSIKVDATLKNSTRSKKLQKNVIKIRTNE